jgi:uncharacterized protein (TIGR03067 family)
VQADRRQIDAIAAQLSDATRSSPRISRAGSLVLEDAARYRPLMSDDADRLLRAELEKFQGTWKQVAYERDGVAEPSDDEEGWDPRTTFEGHSFAVTIADGSTVIRGTFTIDPTRSPKAVDWTDTFGPDAGKTFPAIYDFEGDRLIFCAAMSGARPTEFKSKRGEVLRVHVRVK